MVNKGIPRFQDLSEVFFNEQLAVEYLLAHDILNVPSICKQCGGGGAYRPNKKHSVRCGRHDCIATHGGALVAVHILWNLFPWEPD